MNNKEFTLFLIKADIINVKIVNSLNEMGLDEEGYFLNFNKTILSLMGFERDEQTEELYQEYFQLVRKVMLIEFSESQKPLDDLTMEIYLALLSKKSKP
jgi:hypothetical protein